MRIISKPTAFLAFVLLISFGLAAQTVIIPFGATWKYLDNGSNQGTAWRSVSFNDGSWKSGPAELGYGNGDEATVVGYGPISSNKYITTYFRKTVTIANASLYKDYTMKLVRDDGAVVYINGIEVYRTNMPTGTITYTTKASISAPGGGKPPVVVILPASVLVTGTNVIAVEVHQSSISSSDISFNLELVANQGTIDQTPPKVLSINRQSPVGETTAAKTVVFRAVFSETVTGVDVSDFALRGTVSGTIASLSGSGTTYDITVNAITGTGTLGLNLKSSGTGINDAAGNAISGGFTNGQSYTIVLHIPTLSTVSIASNNSNSSLARVGNVITLRFTASEPITTPVVNIATHPVSVVASGVNSYTATYTMTSSDAEGVVPFRIDFKSTDGTAGIQVTSTTNNSRVTFDKTAPVVVSINRSSPISEITSSISVVFRTTFSEAISGVNVTDFNIRVVSGSVTGNIASVAGVGTEGKVYEVTVNSITGTGTFGLNLNSSGTGIIDAAGNAIISGFITGQTYNIQQTPSGFIVTRGPYLQVGNQTAMTLRWRTDVATDSKIEVGTALGSYTLSAINPAISTEHEIRIIGLTPGTRYYYRFGSSSGTLQGGSSHYFNTAPLPTSTRKVRVVIFGDSGTREEAKQKRISTVNAYLNYTGSNPAELMLSLGDAAEPTGADVDYQNNFFNFFDQHLLRNHVLYTITGNDDYKTTGQTVKTAPYFSNFSMPTTGESGGVASNNKSFYSFNWGNIHFICLDSWGKESDGTSLYDTAGIQATWLKKDLAANTSKWTIVLIHHPPYTMGSHNSDTESALIKIRQNVTPILERYGVDLVFSAHSHNYERSYLLNKYTGFERDFNISLHTKSSSSAKYNSSTNSCPYATASRTANHGIVYVVTGSYYSLSLTTQSAYPHNALPFVDLAGGMLYLEVEDNRLDARLIRGDGAIGDQFTIMHDVNKISNVNITAGSAVQLTASWIGTYRWSTGAASRTISVNPAISTTYQVSDANGCLKDLFNVSVISSALTSAKANSNLKTSSPVVFPTIIKRGTPIMVQANNEQLTEATIVDAKGLMVRSYKFRGNMQIDSKSLNAGMYFIHLKFMGKVDVQKFIVAD